MLAAAAVTAVLLAGLLTGGGTSVHAGAWLLAANVVHVCDDVRCCAPQSELWRFAFSTHYYVPAVTIATSCGLCIGVDLPDSCV
jgi:hypothetical protein